MDQVVHICLSSDWEAAQIAGEYRAVSLENEGFIHFSKPEQAIDTANRYYAGNSDLLLLWIDTTKLKAELRWETSHEDVYPHLYGPLNLNAILGITNFNPDPDGVFRNFPVLSL